MAEMVTETMDENAKAKPLHDLHGVVRLSLTEDTGDRLVAEGVFGKCGEPTDNGRVYRRDLIEREIQRRAEAIEARGMYGHLDHPEDGKTKLEDASHIVTGLRVRPDGVVWGQLEVLEGKEKGDELAALVRNNTRVGVSSRGVGSVKEQSDGNMVVQDNFKLLTYDVVADPAADGAHPEFEAAAESVEVRESDGGVVEVGFHPVPADVGGSEDIDESELRTETEDDMPEDEEIETVEDLKQEHPELVDKLAEGIRDQAAEEARADVEEFKRDLEERFAENVEKLRGDMGGDGGDVEDVVAEAAELFREEVAPQVAEERANERIVEERDRLKERVRELQDDVAERDRVVEDLERELEEQRMRSLLADHYRRIPMRHRDSFEEIVGDASDYASYERFERKVEAVVEDFRDSGRYVDAHVDELIEERDRNEELVERLDEANDMLVEARDEIEALREDNERLAEAKEDRDEILREAREDLNEMEDLRHRSSRLESLLSEARSELEARDRKIAEWRDLLAEARDDIRRKESRVRELERKLERAELERYKAESVIGSKDPNSKLRRLQECDSKDAVDSALKEENNRDRSRTPSSTRVGNADPDTILSEETKDRIRQKAEEPAAPEPDGSEGDGAEAPSAPIAEGGGTAPEYGGSADTASPPSGGDQVDIGMSPNDLKNQMESI